MTDDYSIIFFNVYSIKKIGGLLMAKQESNFLKVKCGDCESHQIIFDHAASTVKCNICGKTLVEPKGGRSKIYAQIVEVLEH